MCTPFSTKNPSPSRRFYLAAGLALLALGLVLPATAQAATVTADVVVLDHFLVFNRLGAQNQNGMIYALKSDVVDANNVPLTMGGNTAPFKLRPDKRPRPLVLRVNAGDTLEVTLTNLLTPLANPFPPRPDEANDTLVGPNNQVAGRCVSFHPQGLELAGIDSDSSNVGLNASSLVCQGDAPKTYTFNAVAEGAFLVTNYGATFGGEATGGNVGVGLFAQVNVEPTGSLWYRSQVTEEELRLAADQDRNGVLLNIDNSDPADGDFTDLGDVRELTAQGHPILLWNTPGKGYEAKYPNDCEGQLDDPIPGDGIDGVWCQEGKAGKPILNMLDNSAIFHSDLNAIIAGPNGGFFNGTYDYNPTVPNRDEPFREYTVIFHDEQAAAQAFPGFFNDPVLGKTLHGVRDSFMINYGSGGIGAEIIANRLGVGPMHDCLTCAYEEFFLTSFTVGDPAMLVDVPANVGLETIGPGGDPGNWVGPKATKAFFPADPSNVHHSYISDRIKFRNTHAGPKEQHIFHLHNHQWLFNPDDDNSNYIDAQGIGPGSGYTYEINFGGAGNRNKTAGDAIFHCHFYPHFAQGMWAHIRNHDVMETGTKLAVSGAGFHTIPFDLKDGTPAAGTRALPDGEIVAGTPIPAVVPLPGKPMAPMPGEVTVKVNPNETLASFAHPTSPGGLVPVGSLADVIERDINPGFPFWIAGIEDIVGQRPTTPPLDMLTDGEAAALASTTEIIDGVDLWQAPGFATNAGGWDGGLPRHALDGYAAGGHDIAAAPTRLDFTKPIEEGKPVYFPEAGTDLEQVAMAFHAQKHHDTYLPDGTATTGTSGFRTNGGLPQPSAPYNEPCIDDEGDVFLAGANGQFFGSTATSKFNASPQYGAGNPRVYKGANLQFDAVFNKVGYHYPQQRIIALWDDVMPTINQTKPPEPLVMRLNTFDCTKYLHTNLVPEIFELDDYQVATPTDIIGQHIHLPKWDLTSTDGAANGWNYEDGTLAPGAVRERIHAINLWNNNPGNTPVPTLPKPDGSGGGLTQLTEVAPAVAGFPAHPDSLGARVTIQRWFVDPVVNLQLEDRGLGIIFTHDHYGPSTHQQIGLYATVLAEPARSTWKHNETGVALGTRGDGGPTSWQAIIEPGGSGTAGQPASGESYREFYFEFSDFQHAYEADWDGVVDADSFLSAINPSYRLPAQTAAGASAPFLPDIVNFPPGCPGGVPRPCPEAISADDVGMLVVNYRNEPVGLRVFDPGSPGPDGKNGTQAEGLAGDLAFALSSEIFDANGTPLPRAIPEMNQSPSALNFWNGATLNSPTAVEPGDPFTPMIRGFAGDLVRVKIQAGGHEHEHNATIHGVRWLQGGSGHGASPTSGWRNAQNDGISEQFTFTMPVTPVIGQTGNTADYAYSVDASQDGWWSGMWGIMRSYNMNQGDLEPLDNGLSVPMRIANPQDFNGACPADAPLREYDLTAVLANDVLAEVDGVNGTGEPVATIPGNIAPVDNLGGPLDTAGGTLVYNPRATALTGGKVGPLHDPTAMLYVHTADLVPKDTDPITDGVQPDPGCFDNGDPATGNLDPKLPTCPVELAVGVPVEPVVLRAAAGECIDVRLRNKLLEPAKLDDGTLVVDAGGALVFENNNQDLFIESTDPITGDPILVPVAAADVVFDIVPDLAGYNTLLQMVNRGVDAAGALTTFNNNLIRPSASVGLHAQLVEYDITKDDGVLVGTNPQGQGLVKPGGNKTFRWYAGLIERQVSGRRVTLSAHPVEFGGTNLSPADKIKQGQKGLVGALIIEPQGSAWTKDATMRAAADVGPDPNGDGVPNSLAFRDFAAVFQKGLNLRYGGGEPVENIAGEGGAIPEDSHDAGQKAINYGTEPAWFRFGLNADANFELALAAVANPEMLYDNDLVGGDPATPVFTAAPGNEVRMRVLEPTGVGRGTTFNLHGHGWQRDPYLDGAVPSQTIGNNPNGLYLGHQESVTPAAHFDIVLPSAGGTGGQGDYLFRDHGSFGNTDGLWGILRVAVQPENTPPVVTITTPANGSSFPLGETVTFEATATDAEDGDISANIGWNSSIDGDFGTGALVTISTLSPGTHTITASVTDSAGAPGSDSITVTIVSDADMIFVDRAVYRTRQGRWNVQGTGTIPGALITVTHDRTGATVGSTTVGADGTWQINGPPEDPAAVAVAGDTITAVSSGGGTDAGVPVTVRR